MKKRLLFIFFVLSIICLALPVWAANETALMTKGKILFVPHDGRPISNLQTADVVRKLGYEVIVPPQELLGDRDNLGNPEKLWSWTEENAKGANAAVVSADSLIYGSLVASRKHQYATEQLTERASRFAALRKDNPTLKLFVFGSIMRTPKSGAAAGSEEPDYYAQYGNNIFRYTELADHLDSTGLTSAEKSEYMQLQKKIPAAYLQDWLGRRVKNFAVNKTLLDLTKAGTFDYFILGKDDNAPFSQTHMESRKLAKYALPLTNAKFQNMTGIDEMGMLLLTRAVNYLDYNVPFVYVQFNKGKGGATIPDYSDERIDKSIRDEIAATGAVPVSKPEKADVVLLVNTNPNGKTYDSNDWVNVVTNNSTPSDGTLHFTDLVSNYIAAGYPVSIADIAFANGADNALMEQLKKRNLLLKLQAYAGWNTATNSAGFVMGESILAKKMKDDAKDQLLLNRYLEDWGYQVNVRNKLMEQVSWLRHEGTYSTMGARRGAMRKRATSLLRQFAEKNLPPFDGLDTLTVDFPWDRGFEASIVLGK